MAQSQKFCEWREQLMRHPIGCLSKGVFKAGKFEKEISLQFSQNEMYFYDIYIKLFKIV